MRTHLLLESREVAVDGAGTEVVDKWQVFTDVFHWPGTEKRVQQTLVPTYKEQIEWRITEISLMPTLLFSFRPLLTLEWKTIINMETTYSHGATKWGK